MRTRIVALIGALLVSSVACSTLFGSSDEQPTLPSGGSSGGASTSAASTSAPQVATQIVSGVLLKDDFSDPSTGWEVGDYDTGSVGYQGGSYSVVSLGNGDTMWGIASQDFGDVVIEVTAEQVSGPANDNNDYGVMCRIQESNDGYFLLISGDGYYAILKRADDQFENLVDWTPSDAINTGDSQNQIQAVCDGSSLALIVNGQQVATASDSDFSHGDIALTATSYESDSTEVLFDNFAVRQP
ncbi:MAG: hypothetical protein WBR18_07930 [Anaerolineales bacterium]